MRRPFILLACAVLAATTALGQTVTLKSFSTSVSESTAVEGAFEFDSNVTDYPEAQLLIKKIDASGAGAEAPLTFSTSGSQMTFRVAPSDFPGADAIAVSARLAKAGSTVYQTPVFRIGLTGVRACLTKAADLQRRLDKARVETTTKQDQLDAVMATYPTRVNFVDVASFDKSVKAKFSTVTPGHVHVKLTGGGLSKETTTQPGVTHTVTFDPLLEKTTYELEAYVVDVAGNRKGDAISATTDNRLRVTTGVAVAAPTVTVASAAKDHNSVTLRVETTIPSVLHYRYSKQTDVLNDFYQLVSDSEGLSLELDDLGRPKAAPLDPKVQNVSFANLEPDTQYKFEIMSMNKYGVAGTTKAVFVKTLPKPAPLSFSGPVEIELQPTKLTFRWAASIEPQSATLRASVGSDVVLSLAGIKDSTNAQKVSVEVPVALLTALLTSTTTKKTAPEFHVEMTRGAETVSNEFKVTVGVPAAGSIASQVAGQLTPDRIDRITRVVQGTTEQTNRKKFSWQDLVSTGLGVFLASF